MTKGVKNPRHGTPGTKRMQRHDIGPHGLALIKGFESFVPFVYDDKIPMRRNSAGKLEYPEWQGGPVKGTLTIGYGHTDAARHPFRCTLGARITIEQATEILHTDLSECIENVNSMVKVPLTQGEFDALTSFDFNCGPGNLRRLIVPLNNGDYDVCRGDFAHYVRSKGEVMRGLERRRQAEQVLWDDRYQEIPDHIPTEDTPAQHPAEVDARPEKAAPPLVNPAAVVAGAGAATEAVSHVNDALNTIKETQTTALDVFGHIALSPMLWVALIGGAALAFIWWKHRTA
jgi:lysozyme